MFLVTLYAKPTVVVLSVVVLVVVVLVVVVVVCAAAGAAADDIGPMVPDEELRNITPTFGPLRKPAMLPVWK